MAEAPLENGQILAGSKKCGCAIGMTGRKELKMDNEFGYGMKYYNDDDPALLRLEALKEAQDLWYETQDWREEANLNNADDEEMEDFIFEHAREKIHDLTPNDVRIFLYT